MNKNMKKIVELSNCEWIQKQWKQNNGDYYFFKGYESPSCENGELMKVNEIQILGIDEERIETWWVCVWLPIGFDPKTGNWQIDDLLMEILKCDISHLKSEYIERCQYVIDAPDFDEYNDIILKLVWLRKLIINEKQGKEG